MKKIALENEQVRVEVMPELGGKISSLFDKASGFEVLFQNPKGVYELRHHGDLFEKHDASGFDDAFPNIDVSRLDIHGKDVLFPDHGEIWTTPLNCQRRADRLDLSGSGTVLNYSYQKSVSLKERGMQIYYRILNNEPFPIPCLWTMHCLMNCYEGCTIELPTSKGMVLNLFDSAITGPIGTVSIDQHPEYQKVPAYGPEAMFKYYLTEAVQSGHCSVYYPREELRCTVEWDPGKLPYFGIWCTMGGYRGDCNIAPEPTTGYYDEVDRAIRNKRLKMLEPGEAFEFDIAMSLE